MQPSAPSGSSGEEFRVSHDNNDYYLVRMRFGFGAHQHSPHPLCVPWGLRGCSLQNLAGALLPEGIHLLAGEAHQQTVLGFMFGHVAHDVRNSLGHRDTLDRGLPPQLLGNGPLLLEGRSHHVHNGCL